MIIAYVGSKWRIAPWIIKHFPKHRAFVDVFGGSGAMILRKPPSKVEIYNDINSDLVNLFEIIRKRKDELLEQLKYLMYSRKLYEEWCKQWKSGNKPKDPLERAVQYLLLMHGSMSGKLFSGFSSSAYRSHAVVMEKLPEKIEFFAKRFKHVIIENSDYKKIFKLYDSPETLFYCDPPYFVPRAKEYYIDGWSYKKHKEFAKLVNKLQGYVVISYYWFPQLQKWYLDKGWYIDSIEVVKTSEVANFKSEKTKVKEYILMNYDWREVPKFVDNYLTIKISITTKRWKK